jgi:hypothetical protein
MFAPQAAEDGAAAATQQVLGFAASLAVPLGIDLEGLADRKDVPSGILEPSRLAIEVNAASTPTPLAPVYCATDRPDCPTCQGRMKLRGLKLTNFFATL